MNLLRRSRGTTAITQLSSNQAAVSSPHLSSPQVLTLSSELKGADVWDSRVLVWRADGADVYELGSAGAQHVAAFPVTEGALLAIHHSSIFQTDDESVKVLDFQGVVKQILPLNELQGKAVCLDVSQEFLVLATATSYIRMWRINDADVKPYGITYGRRVVIDGDGKGELTSIRCNSDCSKISFLVKHMSHPGNGPHIHVYDTDMDKFFSYDFRPENQEPVSHCWDGRDPRLLACETTPVEEASTLKEKTSGQITTFFVSYDNGIVKLEQVDLASRSGLLGVDIPYIHLLSAQNSGKDVLSFIIENRTMRDFVGLEDVDLKTMAALVDFNYHLAEGNVDYAYVAMKDIADKEVWKSIACNCVKTRRVEVALHCFAKMGCAAEAAFVRASYSEPEEDVRVAAVAIQLDLLDEAKESYIRCRRYDLLNLLHQTCGEWEKAIEVASKHDRIHLKGTQFAYAKHLESIGNTKAAIHHYELSGTHRCEVPRMLYSMNRLEELQIYVDKSKDPALQRWWGHYCEANDLLPSAIEYYNKAGDISSLVRVYCFQKDFSMAASVVLQSSNAAAAFDLARQVLITYRLQEETMMKTQQPEPTTAFFTRRSFPPQQMQRRSSQPWHPQQRGSTTMLACLLLVKDEAEVEGNVLQAIKFFSRAGKWNYAARLAMKHNIDKELLALSLQSTQEMMLTAAQYYEDKDKHEEAVLLYHKGGDLEKAINVCFRTQLFDALKAIAEDLSEDSDPLLLAKCGDFLMQHKQVDKVVQLYIAAKQYHKALDLCASEGTILTDKMAEAMAPRSEEQKTEESISLLYKVAEVFNTQGSYHLACKKYTQAGDRVLAMKALLKSGDTERIIFFANLSRQNQIYIMAANYLQSLDWHHDANIMKTIIQMYTKAGDMDSLASFYEACAQIEIDEFRDYGKALGAMKEALKYLSKSTGTQKDEKLQSLVQRITEVERFVEVRRMTKCDPTGMIRTCSELLLELSHSTSNTQAAVRVGDLYALMIEFHHSQGQMEQAYQLIEKMRARNIVLGPYVDPRVVHMVYQAMGMEISEEDLGDGICEEIDAN